MASAPAKAEPSLRDRLEVKSPEESIPWMNFLFYGDPGAGKTFLLGTAQDHKETSPVLILDVEGGTVTLRHRNIDVIQVRTMRQVQDVINELANDKGKTYKSVGVDSGTELQKLDMRSVMKEQYDKKPETTDLYVPSQREWGKSGERMRMIVRALKDLPIHTFVTCLCAVERDERTNKTMYGPSLPGKLKSEIPGFFDIVGYLRAKDEKGEGDEVTIVRTLQVTKTEAVVAKDRTSALGTVVRAPTIPLLWDTISGINGKGVE